MKSWKTLVGVLAASLLLACGDDDPSETADAGDTADMSMTEDVEDDGGTQEGMTVKEVRSTDAVANLQAGATTDEEFTISNVVVSTTDPADAQQPVGFYVQDSSGAPENSGLYVTANAQGLVPPLTPGDIFSATGKIQNNGGQLEMTQLEFGDVSSGSAPTAEIVSDVSALESGDYDGVYVGIENQTVASWDPANNDGAAEFDSGLVIGTGLYDFTTDYSDISSGDTFTEVNGVLSVIDGERRVLPRNESDLVMPGSGSGGG